MIPITPDIIGPGIEEEYADAMERIGFLLDAFEGYEASNDTAHGRVVYQLLWLRQEIEKKHLPIPVAKSWIGTLCHVVGSGEVDDTKEIALALEELAIILQGPGLIKPRHFPVVVAQIDDLVADIHRFAAPLTEEEDKLAEDLAATAVGIRSGDVVPPLEKTGKRHPLNTALLNADRLEEVFPQHPDKRRFFLQAYHLRLALFSGWRPYPAAKPPLPAPNPGLPPEAPDFTHLRDEAKRQAPLGNR